MENTDQTPPAIKPKRTLSPEQIEKLKVARLKAAAAKRANKELDNYDKNKKKLEREKKRDEAAAKILKERDEANQRLEKERREKLKAEIIKPPPKPEPIPEPIRKIPKVKKQPPPKEESEEEEEEAPPPKEFIRKPKPALRRELTDDELYSKASIEMLKQRFHEQTRRRLASELFNY